MTAARPLLAILAFALTCGVPAAAAPLPPIEEVPSGLAERALLPRLRELFAPPRAGIVLPVPATKEVERRLSLADALLLELPRPTRFRGIVQLARGDLLAHLDRDEEAMAAATEAISLLPGYSGPHLSAGRIRTYSDRPVEAADHFLAAGAIDLQLFASWDDYDVSVLARGLEARGERGRLARLGDMLGEAGWHGTPDTVSTLALARIEARLEAGDPEAATALLGEVSRPSSFVRLLTETRFRPVRAAAVALGGARLEKVWPRYLDMTRAEAEAQAHGRSRQVHAGALYAAGHDRSLIETYGPRFEGAIDPSDQEYLFEAGQMARAYAQLGLWERGYALLDKVAAAFADQDVANRLNLESARAQLLGDQGRPAEALAAYQHLIDDSARRASQVGGRNLALMHAYRACLLEGFGRKDEAASSWTLVRGHAAADPSPLAIALMCRGDLRGTRGLLVAALRVDRTREAALELLRPPARGPYPGEHGRREWERWQRLRADSKIRAALAPYAVPRSEPLNAAAPPDPATAVKM